MTWTNKFSRPPPPVRGGGDTMRRYCDVHVHFLIKLYKASPHMWVCVMITHILPRYRRNPKRETGSHANGWKQIAGKKARYLYGVCTFHLINAFYGGYLMSGRINNA